MKITVFEVLIDSRVFKVCRSRRLAEQCVIRLVNDPNGPFGRPWIRESQYFGAR